MEIQGQFETNIQPKIVKFHLFYSKLINKLNSLSFISVSRLRHYESFSGH